jgi:hypothetical protein
MERAGKAKTKSKRPWHMTETHVVAEKTKAKQQAEAERRRQ